MTCIYSAGYESAATYDMRHARVLHSGLWQTGGTITPNSTETGYSADAPDGPETWQLWRPTGAPGYWVHEFGAGQTIDCAGLVLRDIDAAGTVKVQWWDGGAWNDALTADMSTLTNGALMFLFAPVTTDRMRVSLITGVASLAVAKFGQALEMPRPVYGDVTPPELNPAREFRQSISDGGEMLGRTETRRGTDVSVTWKHVPRSWAASEWQDFGDAAAAGFFIAWNPLRSGMAEYAAASGNLTAAPMGIKGLHECSLSAVGYGRD